VLVGGRIGCDLYKGKITHAIQTSASGPETVRSHHAAILQCCKFLVSHNMEANAVDLLEEMERIERIGGVIDEDT